MTETNARTREKVKQMVTEILEAKQDSLLISHIAFDALNSEREEARREAIEECAELCLSTWKEAPNEKPHYKQNQISHGCIASNEAILSLLEK